MWSVWLVFCDCGFHSVCPLMDKDKRLMEASWWKLGLVLMRAMLSKSLIHFLMSHDPDAGKGWRQEEKGTTEDEMVGWHHWTWIRASSRSWWWTTGKPVVLQSMRSQRVGHDWATELSWLALSVLITTQWCWCYIMTWETQKLRCRKV